MYTPTAPVILRIWFTLSEGGINSVVALLCVWLSFRHKQGSEKDVKVTAVELTEMTDSDSEEELDTATSVDNICYERVPSKLSVSTNGGLPS